MEDRYKSVSNSTAGEKDSSINVRLGAEKWQTAPRWSLPRLPTSLILSAKLVLIGTIFWLIYGLADFPEEANPDRFNYQVNYDERMNSYEGGYEAFQWVCRDLLNLSFDQFWRLLLVMQIALVLGALYIFKPLSIALTLPSLIFVAQSVVGTQVRYGIAISALFFALAAWHRGRKRLMWVSALFGGFVHYFAATTFIFVVIFRFVERVMFSGSRKWSAEKTYRITAGFVLGVFICGLIATQLIEVLAAKTRYSSYIATEFFERKSINSLVYTLGILVLLLIRSKHFVAADNAVLKLHVFLLCGVILLYQYSIIGGRLLIMSMYLEGITQAFLWKSPANRDKAIALGILIFSTVKLIAITRMF